MCYFLPQGNKRSGVVHLLLSPAVLTEVVIHGLSSPVDRVRVCWVCLGCAGCGGGCGCCCGGGGGGLHFSACSVCIPPQVWAAARVLVSHVMSYQLHDKGGDVSVFASLWPYLEVGGYEDVLERQVREVMSRGAGLTRAERARAVTRTMFCKDSQ